MSGRADEEPYRAVLACTTPDGGRASLIITRRSGPSGVRTWLTFDGARKTTAVLTGDLAAELIRHLATKGS